MSHIPHLSQAFLLECGITDCQHLIHQQNLRLQVGGDGKGQAHVHAARIALDGCIDELFDLGEIHDLVEFALDFNPLHAQDGAVQVDVLAPGQFGVEAGAHLEQAGDAALDLDPPAGGGGDAREDLEQGALAGAVAPDDPQHLALLDFERNVLERPERLTVAGCRGRSGRS